LSKGAGVGCGERFPEVKEKLPEASTYAPSIKRAQDFKHWGRRINPVESSEGKLSRCISGGRMLDMRLAELSREAGLKMTLFYPSSA